MITKLEWFSWSCLLIINRKMGQSTISSTKHGRDHRPEGSETRRSDASSSNAEIFHQRMQMELLTHSSQFGTQLMKIKRQRSSKTIITQSILRQLRWLTTWKTFKIPHLSFSMSGIQIRVMQAEITTLEGLWSTSIKHHRTYSNKASKKSFAMVFQNLNGTPCELDSMSQRQSKERSCAHS